MPDDLLATVGVTKSIKIIYIRAMCDDGTWEINDHKLANHKSAEHLSRFSW